MNALVVAMKWGGGKRLAGSAYKSDWGSTLILRAINMAKATHATSIRKAAAMRLAK